MTPRRYARVPNSRRPSLSHGSAVEEDMWQTSNYPRGDRAAYECKYTVQPTEDRHDEPTGDALRRRDSPAWGPGSASNYKPTPLRWPFISAVIALLLVGIVLVVVAEKRMPNSDSSARIMGIHPNATQPVRFARAVFTNTSAPPVQVATTGVLGLSTTLVAATTVSAAQGGSSTSTVEGLQILVQGVTEMDSQLSLTAVSVSTQSTKSLVPAQTSQFITSPPSHPLSVSSSVTLDETTLSDTSSGSVRSTEFNHQNMATESTTATPSVSITTTPDTGTSTSSSASLPSGAQVVPVSTSVSKFTTSITIPVSTVTYTSVFTSVETVPFSSDSTYATTFLSTTTRTSSTTVHSPITINGTETSMPVTTMTSPYLTVITVTSSVTTATVDVSTRTALETVTATSTLTGVVIPSVGEVTITYYSTILPSGGLPVSQPPDPVVMTGVDVDEGGSVEIIQTQGPVIVVVPGNEVKTDVAGGAVSTGVVRVGGSVVTNVVVITPSPGPGPVTVVNTPDPVTRLTVVNGVQRTIVEIPPPQTVVQLAGDGVPIAAGQPFIQTVVNNVGGTPVTRVVVTTPAGPPFLPISYTVVHQAGGTLFTEVIVTTPTGAPGQPLTFAAVDIVGGTPVTQVVVGTVNGGAFQPVSFTFTTNVGGTPTVITVTPGPTTIVETINGTPITSVTTPSVTSFTTTVGGSSVTSTIVTTPAGTEPITLTLVSTTGGTLSTFTTTVPPTTFLTTISGTPRTITSTPSPRTSISTRPRSTRTFISTIKPPTRNLLIPNPAPTVVSSTRTYRWTEADIFLGTFLPALLGVALVIPLRIIDLNAKLYQPFQSLTATNNGGSCAGTDTLLLQYTGLLAFVTPVAPLVRAGQPVPFFTTVMVGLASFMVPLATEAVGLKLYGECWVNTASEGCGPALGVSPGPAYVLVALMAVVMVILGVVMYFVNGWVTGVRANPWSLAGITSLVGSEGLRIRQGGEEAMRRAVADKQYRLGYYTNRAGRQGYGSVLLGDAGRGLQQESLARESEFEDETVAGKWEEGRQQLPFMTLRYTWRIAFILFQLAVLVFVIYYHAYYRGGIRDNGRLWLFLNSNNFGVRFVSAVVGVIIAFCWQSFFLSVSAMTPFLLLPQRTQPPKSSILFTPSTNPFSGIYSSLRHRQPFLFAVSLAAILSEFLPVILSDVPFNLAQTGTAATVCAVLSCLFLGLLLAVLGASFLVRYPPMPVDPQCVAGMMWYVSESGTMLGDFEGVAQMNGRERERRVGEMGRRYFYGVLNGSGREMRLGVDCDVSGGGEDGMGYRGAERVLAGPEYRN